MAVETTDPNQLRKYIRENYVPKKLIEERIEECNQEIKQLDVNSPERELFKHYINMYNELLEATK